MDDAAFGRGKVILLGEHAVVYGAPALAAGIGRGVWARARPDAESSLRVRAWDRVVRPDDEDPLGRAFAALLDMCPSEGASPQRVDVDVELPAGAGLGCSAALGVAVSRALDRAWAGGASDALIEERTQRWEREFHGQPSGVDSAMATYGGIGIFRRGQPLRHLSLREPLSLVVGDSGDASSTRVMVAEVARQRDRDPGRFETFLEAGTSLVENARLAAEVADRRALGQLMDLNHALLSGLMLSTQALETMCAAAREAGAHGAKLTGAGGGGCMIALVDEGTAAAVREAIEAAGFRAFSARIESRSVA